VASRDKRDALSADRRERRQVAAFLKELGRAGVAPRVLASRASILQGSEKLARRDRPGQVSQSAYASDLASLSGLFDLPILPTVTARPPYAYEWTWTKRLSIAPGKLEAHADKATGVAGFDMASKHSSNQLNRSRARAAVGIFYRPTEPGMLTIYPRVEAEWSSYIHWNMRVAHAWGWSGLIVQSFNPGSNAVVSTPILTTHSLFDRKGGDNSGDDIIPATHVDLPWPDPSPPTLPVSPDRWYAIWVWCGGGIRAAGWQTYLGMNVGSDAEAAVDLDVSSIALYFAPMAQL
jgi:hypothetical protein